MKTKLEVNNYNAKQPCKYHIFPFAELLGQGTISCYCRVKMAKQFCVFSHTAIIEQYEVGNQLVDIFTADSQSMCTCPLIVLKYSSWL